MEVVGGRAVHPVNVAVGGFHRWPDRALVRGLVPDLERGLTEALGLVSRVADLAFPTLAPEAEEVALVHPGEYPILEGRIASSAGLDADVADFGTHFAERQVSWSTALHCLREPGGTPYRVGPLARVNLCRDRLPPRAAAAAAGLGRPERNPFRSIVARAVEIAAACEEAIGLARSWEPGARGPSVPLPLRAAAGSHATEAPRGLLWHRYAFDADGRIAAAAIVPPTSQNQARIEADLRAGLPEALALDDAGATLRCEQLVRSYDPCISCATHFLTVHIDRPARRAAPEP
jgi:coenzyme F420-reducing hydrogenase alpha subunit